MCIILNAVVAELQCGILKFDVILVLIVKKLSVSIE